MLCQTMLLVHFFFLTREIILSISVLNNSLLNLQFELELLKSQIKATEVIADMPVITHLVESSYTVDSLNYVPFLILFLVVSIAFFSTVYFSSVSTTSDVGSNSLVNSPKTFVLENTFQDSLTLSTIGTVASPVISPKISIGGNLSHDFLTLMPIDDGVSIINSEISSSLFIQNNLGLTDQQLDNLFSTAIEKDALVFLLTPEFSLCVTKLRDPSLAFKVLDISTLIDNGSGGL
jgi:hypothetical protein